MTDHPLPVTRLLASLGEIAGQYDVILCDIWGVLHNGVSPYASAGNALAEFRGNGGTVVLVSNAPRPASAVVPQLQAIGVRDDAYDAIVTSGDLSRLCIEERKNLSVLHIGPPRETPLFKGLDIKFADADSADYVVCTGFADDETQTVEDYRTTLQRMRERNLWMLCANPDLVVERGTRMIPCAGALALAYEEMGGEAYYTGKPHLPIYGHAMDVAAELRRSSVPKHKALAIGDAIRTDVAGATAYGVASLMIAGGIHAAELGQPGDGEAARWLAQQPVRPDYLMPMLDWRLT